MSYFKNKFKDFLVTLHFTCYVVALAHVTGVKRDEDFFL